MLGFRSKQLTEKEVVHQLKQVLELCETSDYKTKKFNGLLYDYIPYNNGLKTRLELIGRTGHLEQMTRLGQNPSANAQKLERFSVQIASEYGFKPEIMIKTFKILAQAMEVPYIEEMEATEAIVNTVKGNFSKNHRPSSVETVSNQTYTLKQAPPSRSQIQPDPDSGPLKPSVPKMKKRFIRSKFNLMKVLIFIAAMLGGSYYINYYFGTVPAAANALVATTSQWGLYILGGSGILAGAIWFAYRKFKVNLAMFLPIAVLIFQLFCIVLKVESPTLYEVSQITLALGLMGSFLLVSGYAIRLPKGAKDFISYKSIFSYYAAGILYFIGQYLVRISVS